MINPLSHLPRVRGFVLVFTFAGVACPLLFGQASNASLSGRIFDLHKASVTAASVVLTSQSTNVHFETTSDGSGIYRVVGLRPDEYALEVKKEGFKTYENPSITLRVQDARILDITLEIGAVAESVTVHDAALANRETVAVSTVVDPVLVANLPLNGRSFNTLFQLTPGIVFTPSSTESAGGMSVNGQRPSGNYLTIDGVSGNVAISVVNTGAGPYGGTTFAVNAAGSTAALLSVDAVQEFRMQTSTFSAEFGRTPGAQIQIVSRSGSNTLHGGLYEYFRNDHMDATPWFVNANRLARPILRMNNFGGTVGGPILRDKLFFFFSHETLLMRQPTTGSYNVPSLTARQIAAPAFQPFLAAMPLPNAPVNPTNPLIAPYDWAYSTPITSHSDSLRLDHSINDQVRAFFRFSYAPSDIAPYASAAAINKVSYQLSTYTGGFSHVLSPHAANDLRINWSTNSGKTDYIQYNPNGGVALTPEKLALPGLDLATTYVTIAAPAGRVSMGAAVRNEQRQFNVVDNLDLQHDGHNIRLGLDFRQISPKIYSQNFLNIGISSTSTADLQNGILQTLQYFGYRGSDSFKIHYANWSAYAQDSWRVTSRLNLSYGLRWDVNPAPTDTLNGPAHIAGKLDLSNIAQTQVSLFGGRRAWRTRYLNFAPRIGVAYVVREGNNPLIFRAGWGLFYDTGTAAGAAQVTRGSEPYTGSRSVNNIPYSQADVSQLTIPFTDNVPVGILNLSDPYLRSPFSHQWNVSLEQTVGNNNVISISYVGSLGRDLLKQAYFGNLVPNLATQQLWISTSGGSSSYNALQAQFQRRLSRGLDALVSYTWGHAIDNASTELARVNAKLNSSAQRGSSDFDIRHTLAYGLHYQVPVLSRNVVLKHVVGGWSLSLMGRWHTSPPLNLSTSLPFDLSYSGRPDIVPGQPTVIADPNVPGGKRLNPSAFAIPTSRQEGSLGRNVIRLFGLAQADVALSKDVLATERFRLTMRGEAFNITNHSNFGGVGTSLIAGLSSFGVASSTYATTYGGSTGANAASSGSLNSAFSSGGQRSLQLSLRLGF